MNNNTVMALIILLSSPFVRAGGFSEGFENINQLPGNGWVFENRSDLIGDAFWSQGFDQFFPAHEGPVNSYLLGGVGQTGGNVLCDWVMLPDLGFVEQFSFYTRTETNSVAADRLLLVYSEENNPQTGPCVFTDPTRSGGYNLGDYDLVLAVNPTLQPGGYPDQWTPFNASVNGSGQLAFVYFVESVSQSPFNGNMIAIDSINVGPAGPQGTPTAVPGLSLTGMLVLSGLMILLLAFNFCTHRKP